MLENAAFYGAILGLSFVAIRRAPILIRLIFAGWVLTALKYVPFGYEMVRALASDNGGGAVRLASWAVACPWLTLLLVPFAAFLLRKGRDDLACLTLIMVAANWVFFEVFGVHLARLTWPLWTWGVPFLSVATLLVLGPYALLAGVQGRQTTG